MCPLSSLLPLLTPSPPSRLPRNSELNHNQSKRRRPDLTGRNEEHEENGPGTSNACGKYTDMTMCLQLRPAYADSRLLSLKRVTDWSLSCPLDYKCLYELQSQSGPSGQTLDTECDLSTLILPPKIITMINRITANHRSAPLGLAKIKIHPGLRGLDLLSPGVLKIQNTIYTRIDRGNNNKRISFLNRLCLNHLCRRNYEIIKLVSTDRNEVIMGAPRGLGPVGVERQIPKVGTAEAKTLVFLIAHAFNGTGRITLQVTLLVSHLTDLGTALDRTYAASIHCPQNCGGQSPPCPRLLVPPSLSCFSGSAFGVRVGIAACYDSVQTDEPP